MENGKVISFINMKGGVGKTTLCINIAHTLAAHFGKKVLLVDMDPQFNATQSMFTKFSNLNIYSKLRDESKTIDGILQPAKGGLASSPTDNNVEDLVIRLFSQTEGDGHLDMIPGDLEIVNFESSSRGSERILSSFLKRKLDRKYDYILIYTPATYSIYSQSALLASDYFLVPVALEAYSALGYDLLRTAMRNDLALEESDIIELGIIFTMAKEGKVGREDIEGAFTDHKVFSKKLIEKERIKTGNMATFMYDMISTKDNIVDITQEFIDELEGEEHEAI